MRFLIGPDVIAKFPTVRVALLVARGIENPPSSPEVVEKLRAAEQALRASLAPEALQEEPSIREWREAYVAFGANPNKFRNSAEALARRVLSGKDLPSISTLVDLYNAVSIASLLPAGGEDLGKAEGDIRLVLAQGTERFVPMGEGAQPEAVAPGEVIYRDDHDVLCRRWNWRQSEKTHATHATRDAYLLLETLGATAPEQLRAAADALMRDILTHCGGAVEVHVLDAQRPEHQF